MPDMKMPREMPSISVPSIFGKSKGAEGSKIQPTAKPRVSEGLVAPDVPQEQVAAIGYCSSLRSIGLNDIACRERSTSNI